MSLDRNQANIIDKPTEFNISKKWERQWYRFQQFLDKIDSPNTILFCLDYDEGKEYLKEDEDAFFKNNMEEFDCLMMNELTTEYKNCHQLVNIN